MTVGKTDSKTGCLDRWGIYSGYRDSTGIWRPTTAVTRSAIRAAAGRPPTSAREGDAAPLRLLNAGEWASVSGCGELVFEDGTTLAVRDRLPPDLPVGYHDLHLSGQSRPQRIIVSPPGGCYLPDGLDAWGWSVQLYALRSTRSWGIGDLADLRRFAKWSTEETTARLLLVNPLCAATPVVPQQSSPYYPSSRLFRNPLYLSVEAMPGAKNDHEAIGSLAAAARRLNEQRLIDRDAVFKIKMTAFERLWRRFHPTPAFERYRAGHGDTLERFATFCTLAEYHGSNWHAWPARFRHPNSAAVKRFAVESSRRVRFHEWLQWLLDEQLGRAARHSLLVTDLPVGVDPCGADAWCWQDVLATDIRVGAPPDQFNTLGQDWALQPFVPQHLREARYRPFIEALRAALRHARGVRIDHVMGLFRLYWIPKGLRPDQGAYVAYPSEEMLAVLAVESHRAEAFVVGEDLGTIESGVRQRLARHRVLGCAVLWFERKRPARYRPQTLASVTTHDLPTIAGLWSGEDVHIQRALGLHPPEEDYQRVRRRLCRLTGLAYDADVHEIIRRVHRELAQAASLVRVVTVEDALNVRERPNMPGIVASYPNWSLALPVPLDRIRNHPQVNAVSKAMAASVGRQVKASSGRL